MVLSLFRLFSSRRVFVDLFFLHLFLFSFPLPLRLRFGFFSWRSCLCFLFSAAASKSFLAALEKSTDGTFCSYASCFCFCIFQVGFFLTFSSIWIPNQCGVLVKKVRQAGVMPGLPYPIPAQPNCLTFVWPSLCAPAPNAYVCVCAVVEYRRAHHCHTAASMHILLWVKSSVTMSVSNSLASFHVPSFFFHFCFS